MSTTDQFWPNEARLAVSFSLMFEAGGQPISGAPGSFEPIEKGAPDLATSGLFQYGVYEKFPRILDLMDKHQVKLSSFMIGQAVDKAPDLAREIVRRGHEAAAHGRTWQNSYLLDLRPSSRAAWRAYTRPRARHRSAGTRIMCATRHTRCAPLPTAGTSLIIRIDPMRRGPHIIGCLRP